MKRTIEITDEADATRWTFIDDKGKVTASGVVGDDVSVRLYTMILQVTLIEMRPQLATDAADSARG